MSTIDTILIVSMALAALMAIAAVILLRHRISQLIWAAAGGVAGAIAVEIAHRHGLIGLAADAVSKWVGPWIGS